MIQRIVWSALVAVLMLIAGLAVALLAPADYTPLAYCLTGGSVTVAVLSLRER